MWKIPLIILLVSFAVWWQWRKDAVPPLSSAEQAAAAKIAAAVSGTWRGDVTYPWGDKYSERFLFTAEGAKLFGTATFLLRSGPSKMGRSSARRFYSKSDTKK